jgi:nitroreductase
MGIIEKATDSMFPTISIDNENNCLRCGHCESFCPREALVVDIVPEEKIKFSQKDSSVDAYNLSLYMKKRRSIRHFSSQPVEKDLIKKVIDIARYAASGGNQQPVKWLVINKASEIRQIASLTIDWMRSIQNTSHPMAPYTSEIISKWDNGVDEICYNAPHLLFAHIPKTEWPVDPTDAIIAMTHFDIAAPSYGIGTCWAGFIKLALDDFKPLQEALAIPEGRVAVCPMMFGYPKYKAISIPRRNPADIIWR